MIVGIVAIRFKDNAIGYENRIPWDVPEDMKYFKDITTRGQGPNICLMGRKTYESLPRKSLPDRIIYVVSSKEIEGVRTGGSVPGSLKSIREEFGNVNIFICGGSRVYREAMDLIDEFHVTRVFSDGGEADAYFPYEDFKKSFKMSSHGEILESKSGVRYCMSVHKRELCEQSYEEQYRRIATKLVMEGVRREDRTGVGTRSLFGKSMSFDLRRGFPLLTSKRVFWRGVVEELLWFVRGWTDSKELEDRGVGIWKGNTTREFLDKRGLTDYEVGDIGPGYGFQWRHWGAEYNGCSENYDSQGIDQLRNLVDGINSSPHDRRHVVSAWNVSDMPRCALPPCHMFFQVYVDGGFLDMTMYQRSADWFLGVPFNMASYALLLSMLASVTNKTPRRLTMMFGDMHIYENHLDSVVDQMCNPTHLPPRLVIKEWSRRYVDEFSATDFELLDYKYSKVISAPMAV